MKQEDYRSCMAVGLKGKKGLSKEERQKLFCVQSRLCSGKANNEEEAQKLCDEAALQPKTPKKPRASGGKCKIDSAALATCIIKSLDGIEEISLVKLTPIIAGCTGQKVEIPSREKFIKKCFRENAVTGDIKEAQRLRSMCIAEYKAQEAAT